MSRIDHRTVDDAVRAAEAATGLQFCVYLGPASDDTRAHAESLFVQAGLHDRPAVLILVAPEQRKIEIVTAPDARERLPDDTVSAVIDQMAQRFAAEAYADGLRLGIAALASKAGPGRPPAGGTDLPNIIGPE